MLMSDRPSRGWGGGRGGVFSRIAGLGEGGGGLRGQGSELSRDPTTTNVALSFKLLHRQRGELLVGEADGWKRGGGGSQARA